MRKVRRDIIDINPLESGSKLVTYHSWFACPLLDLQADSCTQVRKGGAPLMPPRYLHLSKHVMRNVSRFRLGIFSRGGILHLAQWKWPL